MPFLPSSLFWKRIRWPLVGSLWMVGVITGLALIMRYDFAAGASGATLPQWPTTSRVPLADHGYTMVMFAHPRCPCTRASLAELEKLLARHRNTIAPSVVFFKPAGAEEAWDQTDQQSASNKIPGVRVLDDIDGAEARLFHVETSGHTLLFSPAGQLLFTGGITNARGEVGDSEGGRAIEAILTNSTPDTRETPVFGCPIIPPAARK